MFANNTIFQSTLPARGATAASATSLQAIAFQSTLPARGATRDNDAYLSRLLFQSTLPARGATKHINDQYQRWYISIHAPRTGSDAF